MEREEPDDASFFFFTGDGVFIVKATEVGEDSGLGRLLGDFFGARACLIPAPLLPALLGDDFAEDDVLRTGVLGDFEPDALCDLALFVDGLGKRCLLGKRPLSSPVPAIIRDYFGLTSTYYVTWGCAGVDFRIMRG